MAPHLDDVEPADTDPARREFDRVPLTDQLVGPLAVDLDGADRRRHLVDLAPQRASPPLRSAPSVDLSGRHRMQ